jgi:hypothetical protein
VALPEAVIYNCTGLGARSLFSDQDLTPVKGDLVFLLPQSEVQYLAVGPGDIYMFPRHDGVLLGGTHDRNVWDTSIDQAATERILRKTRRSSVRCGRVYKGGSRASKGNRMTAENFCESPRHSAGEPRPEDFSRSFQLPSRLVIGSRRCWQLQQKRNVRKQITQARSLRAQTKHPPDCLRCRPRLASRQELARETVSRPRAPANTKGTRRESPQLVCLTTFFGSGPAATDPVTCVILALFRRGRQKLSETESGSSSGRQLFALTFK